MRDRCGESDGTCHRSGSGNDSVLDERGREKRSDDSQKKYEAHQGLA